LLAYSGLKQSSNDQAQSGEHYHHMSSVTGRCKAQVFFFT